MTSNRLEDCVAERIYVRGSEECVYQNVLQPADSTFDPEFDHWKEQIRLVLLEESIDDRPEPVVRQSVKPK